MKKIITLKIIALLLVSHLYGARTVNENVEITTGTNILATNGGIKVGTATVYGVLSGSSITFSGSITGNGAGLTGVGTTDSAVRISTGAIQNQLNSVAQSTGTFQIAFTTTTINAQQLGGHTSDFYAMITETGTAAGISNPLTADLNANNFRITNISSPTISYGIIISSPMGSVSNITGNAIGIDNDGTYGRIITAPNTGICFFPARNGKTVYISTNAWITIGSNSIGTPTSPLKITGLTSTTGTSLIADTDGNIFMLTSSKRFKNNISTYSRQWENILNLKPKSFNYKESGSRDIGYIAEDVDALGMKDLVIYDKQGKPFSLKYSQLSIYIIEIIKKQQTKLIDLENRIKILEGKIK